MSYIINNSRGNTIAVVADGTVNTTATALTLVGRGITDYGQAENENYVYLLENFANVSAPHYPILGQLWYNSNTDTISAYNSTNTWTALASQDYVQAQKISPALTGIPTAPTAANGTATTQIATTAFVLNQLSGSNTIVASGNITGGNILTGGTVSASGAIVSSANITGGNIVSSGSVSAVGNVSAANFIGNLLGTIVSATGNVYGANFVGNVTVPAGSAVSTTGNITGGNVLTSGVVSAGGNVYGANFIGNVTIPAGSPVSTTGNVVGGNVLSSGIVSAAGNIVTTNTVIANVVIANSVVTTGTSSAFRLPNLTQTQINALSPQNGDMVYNTTTDLPQVYQAGTWRNFTISYYS